MTIPNPASLSQIFAEFGLPANSRFPTDLYGRVGAPTGGPLAMSFFYGKSAGPTSPPTISRAPAISPGSGIINQTQFDAVDGASPDGTLVDARWILNNQETPATGAAVVANQTGTLSRRNIFRNAAGDTVTYSGNATVNPPPPPPVSFSPDGGTINETALGQLSYQLTCSEPATWTYTASGSGGNVNQASGARSTSIIFSETAGGSGTGKFTRSSQWDVRGQSDSGLVRTFRITLTAEGNQ